MGIMVIPGFSNYIATHDGEILFKDTMIPVRTRLDKDGYPMVTIRNDDRKEVTRFVHRLVAITFIPNPDNKPQVNHINGNKLDSRATNLEWVTNKENFLHAVSTGLNVGYMNHDISKPIVQLKDGIVVHRYSSINDVRHYGYDVSNVNKCLKGRSKTYKGYTWRYQ